MEAAATAEVRAIGSAPTVRDITPTAADRIVAAGAMAAVVTEGAATAVVAVINFSILRC
jgi:hypothetical protein